MFTLKALRIYNPRLMGEAPGVLWTQDVLAYSIHLALWDLMFRLGGLGDPDTQVVSDAGGAHALHSVQARMAAHLLETYADKEASCLLESNDVMAAHCGTAREVVSRTLRAFKAGRVRCLALEMSCSQCKKSVETDCRLLS